MAETQDAFAWALLHPQSPSPRGVTTSRGTADALRFAVYRNNVHVSLTTALGQRFPVTKRLVGDAFFISMARAYAEDHKPQSPLIMDYGDTFPAFIATFPPAASLPYLPDVARLEVAWSQAYHAADADPLEVADLRQLDPEQFMSLVLRPHPAAQSIISDYPVGSIWSAHQEACVVPIAEWRPETVLVVRPSLDVHVHMLPPSDTVFAASLLGCESLGLAAEAALAASADFDFGSALLGLIGLGAFSRMDWPDLSNNPEGREA